MPSSRIDPPAAVLAPGAGPRHLAWHPSGRYLYAVAELASTVTVLRWDGERGALAVLQTVTTLPPGFAGESAAAEIAVSGDGRYVYASNRGDDSIAVFAVDPAAGTLAPAGLVGAGGRAPRHFALDPSGRWLLVAHQGSDSLQAFRIDPVNGLPSPAGAPIAIFATCMCRFRQCRHAAMRCSTIRMSPRGHKTGSIHLRSPIRESADRRQPTDHRPLTTDH